MTDGLRGDFTPSPASSIAVHFLERRGGRNSEIEKKLDVRHQIPMTIGRHLKS
jgi:hypothetical protein